MKEWGFKVLACTLSGGAFFILGAILLQYNANFVKPLKHAFEGGKALYQAQEYKPKAQIIKNKKTKAVTRIHDPRKAYQGYTLLTHYMHNHVELIDYEGNVVHSWHVPHTAAYRHPSHIHRFANATRLIDTALLLENGDLLVQYAGMGDTPYGYGIARFDKQSKRIWSVKKNTHHDIYASPSNDMIYAISHHFIKKPLAGFEGLQYPQLVDHILVLGSNGEIHQEISLLDAFKDTPYARYFSDVKGEQWDAMHANSVRKLEPEMAHHFPLFEAGDYLVCIRNIQAIAMISARTGKVYWAHRGDWGLPHAAIFRKNGTIALMNNHAGEKNGGPYSTLVSIDPKTKKETLLYDGSVKPHFHTYAWGRLQELPNGNILATESARGRVIELDEYGKIVWQYKNKQQEKWRKVISSARRYPYSVGSFLDSKP